MVLSPIVKELSARYKFNPYPLQQVLDELTQHNIDTQRIDWKSIVEDTLDEGITVENLYRKLKQYYGISRPIEEIPEAELRAIEERAKEYEEEELREMLETAVERVIEAEKLSLRDYIYEELRKVLLETPEVKSKEGIQKLQVALKEFDRRLSELEKEYRTKLQETTKSLLEGAQFTIKAEIEKLKGEIKAPPKAPPVKIPPPVEEIIPPGYERVREIPYQRVEYNPATGKEETVISILPIPEDMIVVKSPDGRLWILKDSKLTQTTSIELAKKLSPKPVRPPKPPSLKPSPPPEGVVIGLPLYPVVPPEYMPPVLPISELIERLEEIRKINPQFVEERIKKGLTYQQIIDEWERRELT
jgi:hypothetical protein